MSVINACLQRFPRDESGNSPIKNLVRQIQAFIALYMLHERKARLALGNQLTLLAGKELEAMWEGQLPKGIAGNMAELEHELYPFLKKMYGEDYDRFRGLVPEQKTVQLSLRVEGLVQPYNVCITFEKLPGQEWSSASVTIRCWSLASMLTDLAVDAALNIVSFSLTSPSELSDGRTIAAYCCRHLPRRLWHGNAKQYAHFPH